MCTIEAAPVKMDDSIRNAIFLVQVGQRQIFGPAQAFKDSRWLWALLFAILTELTAITERSKVLVRPEMSVGR
jgi:hypothetical protein